MKSLATSAAGIVVLLLLVAPVVAMADSVSLNTGAGSYSGSQTITISGTITPAASGVNVFIQTSNPQGTLVDAASVTTNPTTGAFTYSLVAGGSSSWISGTYTVTATSPTASGTTSFTYNSGAPTAGAAISLLVEAPALVWPGQSVSVAALPLWNNGSMASVSFPVAAYYTPAGAVVNLPAPTAASNGLYVWTWTLAAGSPDGAYFVYLEANNTASGLTAWAMSEFQVNSLIANSTSISGLATTLAGWNNSLTNLQSYIGGQFTSLQTFIGTQIASTNTAVAGVSTTLGSQLATINSGITGLGQSLTSLTTAVGNVQTSVNSVNTAVGGVQSTASSIQTTVSTVNTNTGNLSTLGTVLYIAVLLAAIVIVLEIVILIRK
jgi:hypothetical protein